MIYQQTNAREVGCRGPGIRCLTLVTATRAIVIHGSFASPFKGNEGNGLIIIYFDDKKRLLVSDSFR